MTNALPISVMKFGKTVSRYFEGCQMDVCSYLEKLTNNFSQATFFRNDHKQRLGSQLLFKYFDTERKISCLSEKNNGSRSIRDDDFPWIRGNPRFQHQIIFISVFPPFFLPS